MTVQSARAQLESAIEGAWIAVGELVLIVLEDQPAEGSLAATDDLAEQVSELQGELAAARAALADGVSTLDALPPVHSGLTEATWRYWARVRAHRPTGQLRAATRRLGGTWPGWLRSVEQTAARCEEPLAQAGAALQACWLEVCQLVPSTRVGVPAGSLPDDQYRRTS